MRLKGVFSTNGSFSIKKYIRVISLIGLVEIAVLLYMMFNGNPFELHANKKEAALYLQERYTQEMVVAVSDFSISSGYFLRAHPVGNPDLLFLVYKRGNSSERSFTDDYIWEYGNYQVQSEVLPIVKKVFSDKGTVSVSLSGAGLYQEFEDRKHITNEEIPTYQELGDKLIFGSRISIHIRREFDSERANEESQKILDMLNFVKSKQYPVGVVNFSFYEDHDSEDFDKIKRTYFDIERGKWDQIKTIEDIRALQK